MLTLCVDLTTLHHHAAQYNIITPKDTTGCQTPDMVIAACSQLFSYLLFLNSYFFRQCTFFSLLTSVRYISCFKIFISIVADFDSSDIYLVLDCFSVLQAASESWCILLYYLVTHVLKHYVPPLTQ